MGWFDSDSDQASAYDQYNDTPHEHKASLSHELIAGAASFEAMKAYEKHCEENGQPESHELAKELLAGFAGAFIDREVETRGLNAYDAMKAKRHAEQQLAEASAQDY